MVESIEALLLRRLMNHQFDMLESAIDTKEWKKMSPIELQGLLDVYKRKVELEKMSKSGKSGFYDDHAIQLAMYRMIAQQRWGLSVEKLFNVAPKDWREQPGYSSTDQTDNSISDSIPHLLAVS